MKRFRIPKPALVAIAAGVLALLIVACGGDDDSDDGGGDGGADVSGADVSGADVSGADVSGVSGGVSLECTDGRILVGIAKSESEFASFFDIAGTRGTEVAFEQINAQGGIKDCPIETISGDAQSDPAVAAQVARSLIDQGAQILLVPDDFDVGIAAARVGQEAGVLTLSTAASSTQFGMAVGDLFFSGGVTTTELGNAQAKFALDQGLTTTYQVIDEGLAYFTEQDTTYRDIYEAEGGEIVGTDVVDSLGGQSDYGSTISKIQDADPDVIQALMIFPPVGTFIKQLRNAGVDTPVIGNVTLQTRDLPPLVGTDRVQDVFYAGQVYFNGAGVDPDTDPQIVEFTEQYEQMFGNFPEQANGPGSFQVIHAVNQALQQEGVVDAATAAEAIRQQEQLDVPGGTLVRWQDGYAVWNPVVVGFTPEGEFEEVAAFEAE